MILPNVRERVTSSDRALVAGLLGCGETGDGAAADDRLLDAPELFHLLDTASGLATPSAALFLYVAVRHHLRAVGVDDATLSDYLGALLLEFARGGRAHRITDRDDAEYRYLTDILVEAEGTDDRRRFLVRAHLGNFSLWLAGLFPDHIAARRARRGGPDLEYYEVLGARGFRLAAEERAAEAYGVRGVFERAAASFGAIRVGLNRLSDTCFFPAVTGPDRLLRQVADAWRLASQDN